MPKISYGLVDGPLVKPRQGSTRRLAKVGAAAIGLAAVMTGASAVIAPPGAAAKGGPHSLSPDETNRTFSRYESKGCTVLPNDPRTSHGAKQDKSWTIDPHKPVVWRANVSGGWSIVQDAARADHKTPGRPYWGYVRQSCLGGSVGGQQYFPTKGTPVPARKNQIRNRKSTPQKPMWQPVNLRKSGTPVGPALGKAQTVRSPGTLRAWSGVVNGNVFKGEQVRVYPRDMKGGLVKVCDVAHPDACGYVQADKLKNPTGVKKALGATKPAKVGTGTKPAKSAKSKAPALKAPSSKAPSSKAPKSKAPALKAPSSKVKAANKQGKATSKRK